MTNVVEFPGPLPQPEGYSAEYIDKLHSEAFRDLEMSLRDCVKMAEIAGQLMLDANVDDRSLNFAVFEVSKKLTALEKEYEARWHGEVRG
jgi:hypothetical protein